MRFSAVLALLLSPLGVCPPQAPTPPPSRDPKTLVQAALQRMIQAEDAKTRFTRSDLEHTVNHDKKGKLTSEYTALYDDTWINDLPYKRLVEWNGKPLTGADLAAEQTRYDKAVADHQKLDLADRALVMRQKFTNTDFRLKRILTADYRLTELRRQTLNGQLIHVLEADPQPSLDPAHPIPQQRFELWITDADPVMLRIVCDVLDDEPPILRGAIALTEYQIIDGLPLLSHQTYHGYMPLGKKIIVDDSEHTYTGYRRFTTTVTLKSTPEPSIPNTPTPPIPPPN
jgi:hypothetical protein